MNEFHRTRLEKKRLKRYYDTIRIKAEPCLVEVVLRHIERLDKKLQMIESKLFSIADEIGCRKNDIHEQLKVLRKNETLIIAVKAGKWRIKSVI